MITRSYHDHKLWFAILISFLLCSLLLCFHYSATTFHGPSNGITFSNTKQVTPFSYSDPCNGRYIYIHNLPSRFNNYLLQHCQLLTKGTDKPNMCPYMKNKGLGPHIQNQNFQSQEEILLNNSTSWYATNQFLLEVIFHNRMKKYECLTNDSSLASAIFVPSYIGLDVSRFLWISNLTVRDSSGFDLVNWLVNKPEWKKLWGRDHFLVSGTISWDSGFYPNL